MVLNSMIGARVKRKEDPGLIAGAGKFVSDLKLPGMRYVAFVRSPHAHATIGRIDTSNALKHEGVLDVVVGADLTHLYGYLPVGAGPEAQETRSHYGLSVDKVRHVGEAVAAVIAISPQAAADAVEDVVVNWELLPVVADVLEAFKDDAPLVFDSMENNVGQVLEFASDDVDTAFANAPHTLSQRMVSQRMAGVPMEGRAVVVAPDMVTGGLTIWVGTQAPHARRGELAAILGMPENMLRVIAPNVGGGFGVKQAMYPEYAVLSALTIRDKMPHKWVESRMENMQGTTQGRAQVADVSVAFDGKGTILGLKLHIIADVGAYPPIYFLPFLTYLMAAGNYRIPAVEYKAWSVHTNTIGIAAYRGAGRPEATYCLERAIELIADELGIDSVDVRRKNYIKADEFPYKTITGLTYDTGDYETNLNKALEVSKYAELREEQKQCRAQNSDKLLGIGVATYVEMCGFGPFESAVVRVEPGGTVTAITGASPHGQGGETTFAQIIAEQIGADFDKIVVKHGDTGDAPMGVGTFGSRAVVVGGSAMFEASAKVRDKAIKIAAHMLEASPEDIEFVNGRYQVKGVPEKSLSLSEIAPNAYGEGLPPEIESGLEATHFFRPNGLAFPFGTHVAVVEIDRQTGIVTLRDFFSVDDCGTRISPMLVEGQIHGGLAQGIGQALLEEILYDSNGQLITGTLMDYTMPRADNFPNFTLAQTVTSTPANPIGAKGVGEAATIGSTPAVVNAVMDALKPFGIRHIDMPLNAAKIWRAIHSD